MKIHNLGFPRIGKNRELKRATEKYWKKEITLGELINVGKKIRIENIQFQQANNVDLIPINDFSFYDQILDMSLLLGIIPNRFRNKINKNDSFNMDLMFSIARGIKNTSFTASAMTKWFDTNYHYIIPELDQLEKLETFSQKLFIETQEAIELGVEPKPVLISPLTYLKLSKYYEDKTDKNKYDLFPDLLNFYLEIIKKLINLGVKWIQFDEPIISFDLSIEEKKMILNTYEIISKRFDHINIIVANYFGNLGDNCDLFLNLPVKVLHFDLINGASDIEFILKNYNKKSCISLGLIDGRNIWKNDLEKSLELINQVQTKIPLENIFLAPSCSLIHSPLSIKLEKKIDPIFFNWFSFSEEKIKELDLLKKIVNGEVDKQKTIKKDRKIFESRQNHPKVFNPKILSKVKQLDKESYSRKSKFKDRIQKQKEILNLPNFPTTTIGSFPQTKEVRKMRSQYKKKQITRTHYHEFIKNEIKKTIEIQKEIGLDLYVHGEFERNDMVEYFSEQLKGFISTDFGWVQSYGSRYVKPPIIYGSVQRTVPMTIEWTTYADSISDKPVKGMLTGPITILQWSFVRDDQPRKITATEIAIALREEINELEEKKIKSIQIDEPAIREGLPLRKKDWPEYLKWSINCFRLATAGVKDETQIHTHMCYSDFNDIIEAIAKLDADVISIETSRSKMELLDAFSNFNYPNQIGPGVYDIHSPRVPNIDEMYSLLLKASKVINKKDIWVNPDCGLKTRTWEDIVPALKNMVQAAKKIRVA